jgi:hypothetical protein
MSTAKCLPRSPTTAARTALAFCVLVTLGALDAATPAGAQGAWCAYYSGTHGGTNCGFYTLQQCREAISGVGGVCSPSPFVSQNPAPRRMPRHSQ